MTSWLSVLGYGRHVFKYHIIIYMYFTIVILPTGEGCERAVTQTLLSKTVLSMNFTVIILHSPVGQNRRKQYPLFKDSLSSLNCQFRYIYSTRAHLFLFYR